MIIWKKNYFSNDYDKITNNGREMYPLLPYEMVTNLDHAVGWDTRQQ